MGRARWAVVAVIAVLLAGLVIGPASFIPAVAQAGVFTDAFNGNPASPQVFPSSDRWDVVIHKRDMASSSNWDQPNNAHHGTNCDPHPATHTFSGFPPSVFTCRDHVMTSLHGADYGLIYLTPDHMVDFSAGEAIIRFDMSTLRSSGRDWVDLWVSPYEDHLQMPFDQGDVDLQGVPRNAVHITMSLNAPTHFRPAIIRDYQDTGEFPDWSGTWDQFTGVESFVTPSATVRQTFELRLTQSHISFCMPAYEHCWVNRTIQPLTWTRGVVQFGHHSYTPEKDCGSYNNPNVPGPCRANTWHWDNVSISPAVPFTIVKGSPRQVNSPTQTVTFAQPAPAGSFLRFGAIGRVEVSLDGGPFALVQPKPGSEQATGHVEHFSNYWHPVPAGTTRAAFRFSADQWYGGPFAAKDFSLWSAAAAPSPTSTPAPATATNTPTIAPTATETPMPTATATASATPEPPAATPTATPTMAEATIPPTVTPMPVPETPTPLPTATATSEPTEQPCFIGIRRGNPTALTEWVEITDPALKAALGC